MFDPSATRATSSLDIVERFYGIPLGAELVSFVEQTPEEQLAELALRVVEQSRNSIMASRLLQPPVELASKADFVTGSAAISDGLYFEPGTTVALNQSPELKHVILYNEQAIIADEIADWAYDIIAICRGKRDRTAIDSTDARSLARILRDLTSLATLIHANILLPLPRVALHIGWDEYEDEDGVESRVYATPVGALLEYFGRSRLPHIDASVFLFVDDPVLSWSVVNFGSRLERWEIDALMIRTCADRATEAGRLLADHDQRIVVTGHALESLGQSAESTKRAALLGLLNRRLGAIPFTANPEVARHLLRAATLVAGHNSLRTNHFPPGTIASAINYRVPNLTDVTVPQITALRLNEDVFQQVRTAFSALAAQVADSGRAQNYADYQLEVAAAADDIVRPSMERLSRTLLHKRLLGEIVGRGIGATVTLAINSLAAALLGPKAALARSIARSAGSMAQKQVQRPTDRTIVELRTAQTIMMSVLPPDTGPLGGRR